MKRFTFTLTAAIALSLAGSLAEAGAIVLVHDVVPMTTEDAQAFDEMIQSRKTEKPSAAIRAAVSKEARELRQDNQTHGGANPLNTHRDDSLQDAAQEPGAPAGDADAIHQTGTHGGGALPSGNNGKGNGNGNGGTGNNSGNGHGNGNGNGH